MSVLPTVDPVARPDLDLRRRRRPTERVIEALLLLCGVLSIAVTLAIVFILLREGLRFFGDVAPFDFLTGRKWSPDGAPESFGVLPLLSGTLLISAIAMCVAIPLGLGAATYLSEYAKPRTRRLLKPVLELLAGVPTVVFGFFALSFVTPQLKRIFPEIEFFNALSAGLVMGIMIIPTIASLSEDAMRAVPGALREGAYGLGATRRRVSTRVVIPAALSGIAASVILGISRAVGETMIVAIAAGDRAQLTINPLQSLQTMTGYIAQVSLGDAQQGTTQYNAIFAIGLTLFVLTLALNFASQRLVRRFRQVYQ